MIYISLFNTQFFTTKLHVFVVISFGHLQTLQCQQP